MEKVQYPYECTAKGHEGASKTFLAAPPDWFKAKGMTTPRNCQACRDWVKAQVDEMKTCVSCGSKIRLSARSKISYFKKDGPYRPPTECRSCSEGNRPPKGTKKRLDKKKREKEKEKKSSTEFKDLTQVITLQARAIAIDGPYYTNVISGTNQTRIEHLEQHVPGSAHDLTTAKAAAKHNAKSTKSPSSFARGSSFEDLIINTQAQLRADDRAHVREYQFHGRIIRITFAGENDRLELTVLDKLPGDNYGVASTYDSITVSYVEDQPWYNK